MGMMSVMGASLVAVILSVTPAARATQWFVNPACEQLANNIYAGHLVEARLAVEKLRSSEDLDDQACAYWSKPVLIEMAIAIEDCNCDRQDQLKELDELAQFSKKHAADGVRFSDLLIEANFRRVRVYAEIGERFAAIGAAREAQRLLNIRRKKRTVTPTFLYAEAVSNLALARAEWVVKVVVRMAGLTSDTRKGVRAMEALLNKPSVYQPEALYVARIFSGEGSALKAKHIYSGHLYKRYGDNPQIAYDFGVDVRNRQGCQSISRLLEKFEMKLTQNPKIWSKKIRAKLYWLMGQCALEDQKITKARNLAIAAHAEHEPSVESPVAELLKAVKVAP